jgi:hypothetical protein
LEALTQQQTATEKTALMEKNLLFRPKITNKEHQAAC